MQRCLEENIHPLEDEQFYGKLPAHRVGTSEWFTKIEDETRTVTADSESEALHAEYKDLSSRATEIGKQKERIKENVRAAMGDAQKMLSEDGSTLFVLSGKNVVNSENLWAAIEEKNGKTFMKENSKGEQVRDWHKTLAANPNMFHKFMEQSSGTRRFSAK